MKTKQPNTPSRSKPALRKTKAAGKVAIPSDPAARIKLKLARLTSDEKLAARVAKSGVVSVRQLAALPREALIKRLGGRLTKADEKSVHAFQQNAQRAVTQVADHAISSALANGVNGRWPIGRGGIKVPPGLLNVCHCGCCDSVFSLKAYLFDLLDLLANYWGIALIDVEALLLRSFSELRLFDQKLFRFVKRDLHCEELNAPLPQARIAVEVLEAWFGAQGIGLPTASARWKSQFVDRLLRLITPQEIHIPLLSGPPAVTRLTFANVESQVSLLTTDLPEDDERTKNRRAALLQSLQPFTDALAAWKAKLGTLALTLAGIDEAASLLGDYTQSFTAFAPDTLLTTLPENATDEQQRVLAVTQKFEQRREATIRQWLVDYRAALIAASGKPEDTLEARLMISLSTGTCRMTTRLQELVISVQQIIENIRSGEIATAVDLPGLSTRTVSLLRNAVTIPLAEEAWQRFRDYETWLGFMYGWVYPESVLNPLASGLIDSATLRTPLEVRDRYIETTLIREGSTVVTFDPADADKVGSLKQALNLGQITRTGALAIWKSRVDAIAANIAPQEATLRPLPPETTGLLFPLCAAHVLSQAGFFSEAHEWLGLLIHPVTGAPTAVLAGIDNAVRTSVHERQGLAWPDDPYDPIAIASRRPGVWLRHTILVMVRNLIDWADDDFARSLPDTTPRAEERYEQARKLLAADALDNECETILFDILLFLQDDFGLAQAVGARHMEPLRQMRSIEALKLASSMLRAGLRAKLTPKQKNVLIRRAITAAAKLEERQHPAKTMKAAFISAVEKGERMENALFFQPAPDGPLPGLPEPGPDRPPLDADPVAPERPFDEPVITPPPPAPSPVIAMEFCVPLNPVIDQLRRRISNQLLKLNRCLDFLGEPQLPRVYDCDTYDAAAGTINRPDTVVEHYDFTTDQPRYRYAYLIEKARQYVDVAQRLGSLLLQAVQSRDTEAFAQLRAQHAIELADATVELRRLGRREAEHGVDIAGVQRERAAGQVAFWNEKVGDPDDLHDDLSDDELASLENLEAAVESQRVVVDFSQGAIAAAGISAAIGTSIAATGAGAPVGLLVSFSAVAAMAMSAPGLHAAKAQLASQEASLASARASFERRAEDWKNQFNLSKLDAEIAQLQVALANDRLAISGQELVIAQLQLSHARAELRFLQTKVTNTALYDWMTRVLTRDYRALMQIAACVARMAQRALEFERQETVRIVTGDYWNVATDVIEARKLTERQRSLGLLGAERLLTDLTKLDAYKLATEKRRLQISKTISLARMMPTDLVSFREHGVITFNTLLDWFDDDFQGHYLRLIKSVRVTVLAIVPPLDGIHAMLHNSGESSVVVNEGGVFTKKRAARNFGECIALDAPFNESGLFVLNYEDPMLLPFEGLGVETQWTLELPRGNNRFNFDTIADVLLTIDYTAEYSRALEEDMRATRSGQMAYEDTAVPLRLQFPDLWYHLKNPRKDANGDFQAFDFKFKLPRSVVAPNLDTLSVQHLTLLLSGDLAPASDAAAIKSWITISMRDTTLHSPAANALNEPPPENPPVVTGPILLSSRGTGGVSLSQHPPLDAVSDEWIITFEPEFFEVGAKPLIERLSDFLLVITVNGTRS